RKKRNSRIGSSPPPQNPKNGKKIGNGIPPPPLLKPPPPLNPPPPLPPPKPPPKRLPPPTPPPAARAGTANSRTSAPATSAARTQRCVFVTTASRSTRPEDSTRATGQLLRPLFRCCRLSLART